MVKTERRQLRFGDQSLDLLVKRSARRKRRLSLSLNAQGKPLLQVPMSVSNAEIEAMVKNHLDWLIKKQQEFDEHCQEHPPIHFVDGEQVEFLGRELTLAVDAAPGRGQVLLQNDCLAIKVPSYSPQKISAQLQRWYRLQAQQIFMERLVFWSSQISWVSAVPPLRIRRMRSRWGSCSSDGRICLNSELIRLDPQYLDYVIAHELCHLQEFNHSKRFYALMDSVMPDWSVRKKALAKVNLRRLLM
ncbi:putative metal-dependent hydrolase [Spongiibacter sp. IMCC21906]|uniref:M48 family metallopeptidase n=1 Tax=Spongiibacter sp. IMCC21906 TaxID=1620392 RepID=UPI00062DD76D|nr:SprT family zinc-dependent metalloprotease [Spongiibacter sp. IMCC21906]AKH68731.1 putative metal-dependent hydrolase [Spongiibacter sp. IMCC21906]